MTTEEYIEYINKRFKRYKSSWLAQWSVFEPGCWITKEVIRWAD